MFVFVYLNQGENSNRYKTKIYCLPKTITKNYNAIINGKNVYDQFIDSVIIWYEYIKKLITEQGDDYTTGSLLYYN